MALSSCNKRVSPTCLMVFERNRYSVPAAFANRVVSLRVYADRSCWWPRLRSLPSMSASSTAITTARAPPSTTGATTWRWCRRKPGALRNGAPFAELPKSFKRLQSCAAEARRR